MCYHFTYTYNIVYMICSIGSIPSISSTVQSSAVRRISSVPNPQLQRLHAGQAAVRQPSTSCVSARLHMLRCGLMNFTGIV